MAKIFVVEDNSSLSEAIVSYLEVEGHSVVLFERMTGVLDAVRMVQPSLIILDVMLPDGDGFLLARKIKKESDVPVLFLTARASESYRITGFEFGADDYVVKPFSMRELILRVRKIIERTDKQHDTVVNSINSTWILVDKDGTKNHILTLDDQAHEATHDGEAVKLTATEWKILSYVAKNEHIVISRDQLLGSCLDYLAEGSERTINTHMKNIRAKLDSVEWIETVRGFGYRFIGKRQQ